MARRTTPVALLALIFSCLAIQALASRSLSDTNAWKNDDDDDKREEKLNVRPIIGVVAQVSLVFEFGTKRFACLSLCTVFVHVCVE